MPQAHRHAPPAGFPNPPGGDETSTIQRGLDHPARLAALRATGLLEPRAPVTFDHITRLTSRLLDVPIVVVSLLDRNRQILFGCSGVPEPWGTRRELPLSYSLCRYVVLGRPFVVTDADLDPRVDDAASLALLGLRAYVGCPLRAGGDLVLGSFAVGDRVERNWTPAELASIEELAGIVSIEIALRQELQMSSDRRDEALAAVSHDLRTPLNSALLNLQLLRDRGNVTEEHERLQRALQSISQIVEGLPCVPRRKGSA